MSEPFLSEIRIMSFNFAPAGWAACNGQFLPINQNQALFALLGTTYGGNGQTTFQLPDFRGRIPIHAGNFHNIGERAGEEAHTVTISEMPAHNHILTGASVVGNSVNPNFGGAGRILAADPGNAYAPTAGTAVALNAGMIGSVGGSQPHVNMMPYLTLNFCIALQGIFPSQN